MDSFKRTLAHEYGHHWTMFYMLRNNHISHIVDRLPDEYYRLRGLNQEKYYPATTPWFTCDREVIAEDYRVLFAPLPYNQDHLFLQQQVASPNLEVNSYIRNLIYPSNGDR
jgi:hypothetical protein